MRALLVFLAIAIGCGDDPPVVYPTAAPLDETQLPLGPGDKLQLTIFNGAVSSTAMYALDASGEMQVQYIGDVAAGGKTAKEVQDDVQKRLADGYLRDPVVSLTVMEFNSLTCSVLGQVSRSGTIRFVPRMTVMDAIAQSGGFTPLARKNMIKVTRKINGKKETYKIPVELIGEGRRPNFPLMPGDEIFVPERPW